MAQVISFTTGKFDISTEPPNPINPIFGASVLDWIGQRLADSPYSASQPAAEDWGWYISVEGSGAVYLVGASGQPEREPPEMDWMVQVDRQRSFKERLTGRNRMTADDPLAALLETIIRAESAFTNVSVERGA
jgi:hypothetical protein